MTVFSVVYLCEPFGWTSTVTFVGAGRRAHEPPQREAVAGLETVSGTRPAEVQRLGLAAEVLEARLEADRAAADARPGLAAERVVVEQVLRERRHARVAPGDLLGDRVEFGLLGDGHAEVAVGLALDAELGQVDRQVRRRSRARAAALSSALDRRESTPIVTSSRFGRLVAAGRRRSCRRGGRSRPSAAALHEPDLRYLAFRHSASRRNSSGATSCSSALRFFALVR